jgi:hypothetical protein
MQINAGFIMKQLQISTIIGNLTLHKKEIKRYKYPL